ncbi:MAG: FISUMP domain-containing protein [Bacteroidota bacterium]
MKKLTLILSLIVNILYAYSQAPGFFKYQAIIRNNEGISVDNQNVNIRTNIVQEIRFSDYSEWETVYSENHPVKTNDYGLVNLQIGQGYNKTGSLVSIKWSEGIYWMEVSVDITGGENYKLFGSSQILSVPYALHAKTAENISGNIEESDPVFQSSESAKLTSFDIQNLSNLSGVNTGDQDLSFLATRLELEDSITSLRKEIPTSIFSGDYNDLVNTPVSISQFSNDAGYLTEFTEEDGSITNEIQDLSLDGNILTITKNPEANAIDLSSYLNDADADPSNELQNLSVNGNQLTISNGNTVTLSDEVNDADNDPENEIQSLSVSGNQLSISDGNSVTLPLNQTNVPVYTTTEIINLEPSQGDAVFNSTENLYQIYNGMNWRSLQSDCWPKATSPNAGTDQLFSDNTIETILSANSPSPGHGEGSWTILGGGGGVLSDVTDPNATFTGLPCTNYQLAWSVSTDCESLADYVQIHFNHTPTTADAGNDTTISNGATSTTLAANNPETGYGTGQWSIASGSGGSFSDINNPNAIFTGQACVNYELEWTISTSCSVSSDNVLITFNQPPSVNANAGSDTIVEGGITTITLSGNEPLETNEEGQWSIISGNGGSFADFQDPNTTFTGQLLETYTLQWSILTPCSSSSDQVQIKFWQDGPGDPITDIDGNTYNTVYIGGQLWMAENLKTTTSSNGVPIVSIPDSTQWSSANYRAYCWYDNDQTNYGNVYGALYNWHTVKIDSLCPIGWHVPSLEEWNKLLNYIGEAGKLKEAGTEHWRSPNIGATDEFGFTALPGGTRLDENGYNNFEFVNDTAYYWTNTLSSQNRAYSIRLYFDKNHVGTPWGYPLTNGQSIRCIKD